MARAQLNSSNWVFPDVGNAVFVRRNLTDPWTWLPFMYCTKAKEALAPTMPLATLVANFGTIARAEFASYSVWDPYFVSGVYVKVVGYTHWSFANLWYGIIDTETVAPWGNTDVPTGTQTLTAYGFEHLFDRRVIYGSYTENFDGSAVNFVDRPVIFNRARDRGIGIQGNKSTSFDSAFGPVGTQWTNLTILQYILDRWINANTPFNFQLTGVWSVLDDIVEVHDLQGLTPYQAINKLIKRQRGLAWQVVIDNDGFEFIKVISLFPEAVSTDDFTMPANANQTDVSFVGFANVKHDFTFDQALLFDRIVVMGGPIYSTFTLSYEDETLVKDWTESEEDSCKAGTGTPADDAKLHDAERNTDKFERVYQRHKTPDDWDWFAGDGEGGVQNNAGPYITPGGYLDATLESNVYRVGKRPERELPIEVDGTNTADPEYRKPIAIILTEDVSNPGEFINVYVDKLTALGFQNIHVRVADQGVAIELLCPIPHIAGLFKFKPVEWESGFSYFEDDLVVGTDENTYKATSDHTSGASTKPITGGSYATVWALETDTAPTNIEPEIDYKTLVVTINVKTDGHIFIDTANLGYPLWDAGRTKFIEMRDAEAHYIVPGTVIEVTDGALVKDVSGGFVRDDTAQLRTAMTRAIAWYGIPRSKLAWEVGAIMTVLPTGTLVRWHFGPEGWTAINTTVTQRVWRWVKTLKGFDQSTTVETGYDELDFTK